MSQLVAAWPYASLAALFGMLAVPAIVLGRLPSRTRQAALYTRAIISACLAFAVLHAVQYLLALRPIIAGTDFFDYLCVARDARHGATDLSPWRYAYFPGIYRFWRIALALGRDSLPGVQWVYVLVLGVNAFLIGVLVLRVATSRAGAVLAAVGYVALCARLEGGYGLAEPVATVPVLVGVALWAGEPMRGRRGYAQAITLGVGIGLAAYVKQQGALQAAGWPALLALNLALPRGHRSSWRCLTVVPVAALAAFGTGIVAEGQGWLPLEYGLRVLVTYAVQDDFTTNLGNVVEKAWPMAVATPPLLLAWAIVVARSPRARSERWVAVSVFALAAACATFAQYFKRPYLHYALLAAPWLMLVCLLTAVALARSVAVRTRAAMTSSFVFAFLATLPFVRTPDPASRYFFLWPATASARVPDLRHSWQRPDRASDIQQLGSILHPGQDVLILPPRHDEIHFALGTRSISFAEGYGWGFASSPALPALSSPTLSGVLVLRTLDPTDVDVCSWHDCGSVIRNLSRFGFRKTSALRTMDLWQR